MTGDSVRGRIRGFYERHCSEWEGPVLDIGSLREAGDDSANLQSLRPDLEWTGVDIEYGPGVHHLWNVEDPQPMPGWRPWNRFRTVILSEVLEHTRKPYSVIWNSMQCLVPGGKMYISTMWAFPWHGCPDDYFRFSRSCLEHLLRSVGMDRIETEEDGFFTMTLRPRDDRDEISVSVPMHTFARASKGPSLVADPDLEC